MNKQPLVLALLLLVFAPLLVHAQPPAAPPDDEMSGFEKLFGKGPQEEDVYRADQLLISATGSLKPLRLAPSVATIITAEEIKATGATTLDEALETVPGLHVSPSGLNLFSSIWSIRGIRTSLNPQILLLINGIPLTDIISGGRQKSFNMPTAMISRIEVVRGPGSAVYGADAFAGTINVITKDGHEVAGTQTGVRYGSFDTTDAWLQHGGNYSGWNLVAGVESRQTQGDDNRIIDRDNPITNSKSLTPAPLDTRSHQVDTHFGFNKDDRWIGHLYGSWLNDNAMGPGGAQSINNGSTINGHQLEADLGYHTHNLAKNWDIGLQANFYNSISEFFYQYYPTAYLNQLGNPIWKNNTGGLEGSGNYNGFSNHQIRVATGFKLIAEETDQNNNFIINPDKSVTIIPMRNLKDTKNIFLENQNRRLFFLSLQDEWHLAKKWELTAGIRGDSYDDFGQTINPRLALVWEPSFDLTTKLLYGRAFRAPSFSELYQRNNPVAVGNANVQPETIDTYELALSWEPTTKLKITPSVFIYEINGLIEGAGATLPALFTNARNQEGEGVEVEGKWHPVEPLELTANLAYQRSKDKQTGEIVADTPAWKFYTNAKYQFMLDWSIDGQYILIAERNRSNGDPRPDIADYDLVNLTLRRQNLFMMNCEFGLSVRNLFNTDAREPSPYNKGAGSAGALIPNDYPMESRSIWGEFRVHF